MPFINWIFPIGDSLTVEDNVVWWLVLYHTWCSGNREEMYLIFLRESGLNKHKVTQRGHWFWGY